VTQTAGFSRRKVSLHFSGKLCESYGSYLLEHFNPKIAEGSKNNNESVFDVITSLVSMEHGVYSCEKVTSLGEVTSNGLA
jgi:hypothetical protein